MAIKFEKIKAGMLLYDRHYEAAGNTTMRRLGEWKVRVIEVEPETGTARVSWNGNPWRRYDRRQLEKLFTWSMWDDAELERRGYERKKDMLGGHRLVKKPKVTP